MGCLCSSSDVEDVHRCSWLPSVALNPCTPHTELCQPPHVLSCRSRVAVLYTVFSLACALALLLLLSLVFNYPLGLKVGGRVISRRAVPADLEGLAPCCCTALHAATACPGARAAVAKPTNLGVELPAGRRGGDAAGHGAVLCAGGCPDGGAQGRQRRVSAAMRADLESLSKRLRALALRAAASHWLMGHSGGAHFFAPGRPAPGSWVNGQTARRRGMPQIQPSFMAVPHMPAAAHASCLHLHSRPKLFFLPLQVRQLGGSAPAAHPGRPVQPGRCRQGAGGGALLFVWPGGRSQPAAGGGRRDVGQAGRVCQRCLRCLHAAAATRASENRLVRTGT